MTAQAWPTPLPAGPTGIIRPSFLRENPMELQPIRNRINDLSERLDSLRGYL